MSIVSKLKTPTYRPKVLDTLQDIDIAVEFPGTSPVGGVTWTYDQSTLGYNKPRSARFVCHQRTLGGSITDGTYTWNGSKVDTLVYWEFDLTDPEYRYIRVENNTNGVYQVRVNDGATQLTLKFLEPKEVWTITDSRLLDAPTNVQVVGPVMVQSLAGGEDEGKSLRNDNDDYYCGGTIDVEFGSSVDMTSVVAMAGGIAFLSGYAIEEKGVKSLINSSGLKGSVSRIASILATTANVFVDGYVSALIAGLSVGWVKTSDIMNGKFHSRLFNRILRNPQVLAPALASLAADTAGASLMAGAGAAGFAAGLMGLMLPDEYHLYPGNLEMLKYDSAPGEINQLEDQDYIIVVDDVVQWKDATTPQVDRVARNTYTSNYDDKAIQDLTLVNTWGCSVESGTPLGGSGNWTAYSSKKIATTTTALSGFTKFLTWFRRFWVEDATLTAATESLQSVVITNNFGETVWVALWDTAQATPDAATDWPENFIRLGAGKSMYLPYDIVKNIRCFDVIIYSDASELMDTGLVEVDETGPDIYLEVARPGGITVFFDFKSGVAPMVISSALGGLAAAAIPVESLMKTGIFTQLKPMFQRLAKAVGDTVVSVVTGYATAWSVGIGLGWRSAADFVDIEMHSEALTSALQNPLALTAALPALAQVLPFDVSQRVARGGAAAGFSAAVIGALQITKRYFQYV